MLSFSVAMTNTRTWVSGLWNASRGAILLSLFIVLIVSLVWSFISGIANAVATELTEIAEALVALFVLFGFALVIWFFWVFRGVKADEEKLTHIITYCYAFIVFSLTASVLPFVALPLLPTLYDAMVKSPIGIVAGCSRQVDSDEKSVPRELRCGIDTNQWVVNIGGTTCLEPPPPSRAENEPPSTPAPGAASTPSPPGSGAANGSAPPGSGTTNAPAPPARSAADVASPGPGGSREPPRPCLTKAPAAPVARASPAPPLYMVSVRGGLVVPLYVVVLALMGGAVSMTRRVPEFQRRLSPGDAEFLSYDKARELFVFQIMQVASAPLIAVTAYYLVDPGSRSSTIVLSFVSGFSSETVLLLIRAVMEKIRPEPVAAPAKPASVAFTPARLDFGNVAVNQPVRKTVAISNSGQAPLMVRGLTCTGEFSLLTAAPITIAPGSSGNIVVEFKPVTTGSKQGQLSVSDDAPGSPRSVDLTGAGI